MRITLFNKDVYITKRWRQDLSRWSLLYRTEIVLTATGFMMSGYFVGYFVGAATIPNIISRVGHIRVFAAFASLA